MRSICNLILGLFITFYGYSQVTYDTTYTKQWNNETNEWENFDRIISSFDNGLITSELIQVNKNEQWANYNFKAFYYNNGRIIEEFEQYWNDEKLKWEDNYRKLYSYDSEGRLLQITHQYIFKGKYIDASKEILIYSPDGLLKEKIIQKFEKAWSNFMRYQYYYNSNDLLMEENLAFWDEDSWDLMEYAYRFKYDDFTRLSEKIKVKIEKGEEKNLTFEKYFYNAHGRLEEYSLLSWNPGRKEWYEKNKAVYKNDMKGYLLTMLRQEKKREEWRNHMFTEFSGKIEALTMVDPADHSSFCISSNRSGNRAKLKFDNPYNDLYFVRIIDEEGYLIGSTTTDKNEISIETSYLDSGSYFVELQGNYLYSGKFSIE